MSESKREADQFLNTCELSCQMQEFIGSYIMMEEYFMRQMVIKVSSLESFTSYYIITSYQSVSECLERLCEWALRVVDVDEWIVRVIQAIYDGATTAVRLRDGESKEFGLKGRGPSELHLESTFDLPLSWKYYLESSGAVCRGSYSTPMI